MHDRVDLRSDTVTKPTPEMRRAIAEAEVGDDVIGTDPTVERLQEVAAAKMGKEAGLFVPSGSMSNAIAIKTHTKPGDEVLLESNAHSMIYEVGMPATIAQVITRQFRSQNGVPDVNEIAASIHTESLDVHRKLWEMAQAVGLKLHLDGARLFNAVVATGVPAVEYAACADSVTFCLSKGLGCPVGSVLCGTREFIAKARRVRKMLGGGMRQAGILAAAGLYALEHHIERLAEDHAHARRLAQGLADAPGVTLDTLEPPTNMVYLTTKAPARAFVDALAAKQVLCLPTAPNRIRLVTHLDVDAEDIERAISAICEVGRLSER
jgi:threonine aldolase